MAMNLRIECFRNDTTWIERPREETLADDEGVEAAVTATEQEYGRETAKVVRLQAFRDKVIDADLWKQYIDERSATDPAAVVARQFWNEARAVLGSGLGAPVTVPGDDGLHLAWEVWPHYCDVDVFKDGRAEWFYRNLDQGTVDGVESPEPALPLSAALLGRLKLVAR